MTEQTDIWFLRYEEIGFLCTEAGRKNVETDRAVEVDLELSGIVGHCLSVSQASPCSFCERSNPAVEKCVFNNFTEGTLLLYIGKDRKRTAEHKAHIQAELCVKTEG